MKKSYPVEGITYDQIEEVLGDFLWNDMIIVQDTEFLDNVSTTWTVLSNMWYQEDVEKAGVEEKLDEMGVTIEWLEKYVQCTQCHKYAYASPAYYGDQPQYIWWEDEPICSDCVSDFMEEIVEDFKWDSDRALPEWCIADLEKLGFSCTHLPGQDESCAKYFNGLHPGMDDNPKSIMEEARKILPEDRYDAIFVLTESSQFYVGFSIFVRRIPED